KEIVTEEVGMVVKGFEEQRWLNAIEGFCAREFNIPNQFSKNLGLTVEQHCQKIIAYSKAIND
ncbi:MAG: hypothetical protein ACPG5W_12190, partial [Flavobacteriales bacterium]